MMGHDLMRDEGRTAAPSEVGRAGEGPTELMPPGEVAVHLIAGLGRGSGDAVFGGVNDLVLVVGPDGTIEYANPAASMMMATARERIVGRSIADVIHPDDIGRALEGEASVGTPAASVGVGAPLRLRHGHLGWRWLDLSSGRMGTHGSRRTIVTGRLNDDQRTYEDVVALITDQAPVEAVVDALPRLAEWRLPDIPFAVACSRIQGRHVAGHPAAVELLRTALPDEAWLDALGGDGQPHHGVVADLGLAARSTGIRHGLATWVAARVLSADGRSEAIILAATNPDTAPASIVAERVRRMGGMARLVVEWVGQRTVIEEVSSTDPVTGLLRRTTVLTELERLLDRSQYDPEPVAVLACDIDGFRAVNHAVGLEAGDAALAEAVSRITAAAGADAVAGRIGGDEVLVIVRGADARAAAETVARTAIAALRRPLVEGHDVVCGLSVGIAVSDGREHPRSTADGLLTRAEAARAMAKAAGGGRSVTTST